MKKIENKYFIYDKERTINIKYVARWLFVRAENIVYRCIYHISAKKSQKKQYEISICAIFKNESPYLKEWIEYHLIVGVDHFYLYNNNSEDAYRDVLQPYIDKGIVTLIEWPYNQAQLKAYADCIEQRRHEANWIGFIDLDEFVVPKETNELKSFFRKFENRPSVKLYWQLFGSSGLIDRNRNSLVTESFFTCWKKYDEVGKCFYNTKYDFNPLSKWNKGFHHGLWASWRGIDLPPVNCFDKICQRGYEKALKEDFPIQINHYFTKSYAEYIEKASKGDVFFTKNPHNLDFFYRHEMLCGRTDYSILKYMIKLKVALEETEKENGDTV